MKKIPNLDTFSSIVDRLVIEVGKVAFLENKKAEEHSKPNPNHEKISGWDKASREANECRAALKARLDVLFKDSVESGRYETLNEARTF